MSKKQDIPYGSKRTIRNVTLQYPRLAEPDEESGKYSVQCINIQDECLKGLQEIGLEPKHGKDRILKDGSAKPTPEWGHWQTARTGFDFELYDSSGREIKGDSKDEVLNKIGKGTKANVTVSSKPYTKNGGGVSCFIQGIQVIALEETQGECSFEPVEGGFIANPADVKEEDNVPY